MFSGEALLDMLKQFFSATLPSLPPPTCHKSHTFTFFIQVLGDGCLGNTSVTPITIVRSPNNYRVALEHSNIHIHKKQKQKNKKQIII